MANDIRGALVFNPGSGKGKAGERALDFAAAWQAKFGNELTLRPTRSREDIRVAARETRAPGVIQIFMGGDGTLSESIQGLAEAESFQPLPEPVGLLPGGTGNSFLRDFGIIDYNAAKAALLEAVERKSSVRVDAGIITYLECTKEKPERGRETKRITFNIWGIGLISNITVMAVKMRFLGALNYSLAGLIKILTHRPDTLKVRIDGNEEELLCNLVTISNSRYTGGAMEIAPDIRVNDGKLFLVCPQITSRLQLLQTFPKIFKGDHVNNPAIRTQFIQEFKVTREDPFIMNVDGELELGYDPTVKMHPGFIQVYMPQERLSD